MDKNFVDNLAEKLASAVPDDIADFRADLEKNFRSLIASGLDRMDLVTREEFDAQQAVLMKTREKVEALEKRVAELEQRQSS